VTEVESAVQARSPGRGFGGLCSQYAMDFWLKICLCTPLLNILTTKLHVLKNEFWIKRRTSPPVPSVVKPLISAMEDSLCMIGEVHEYRFNP
jgi:hypothetical protein